MNSEKLLERIAFRFKADMRRLPAILQTAETVSVIIAAADIVLFMALACSDRPDDAKALIALAAGMAATVAGAFLHRWSEYVGDEEER